MNLNELAQYIGDEERAEQVLIDEGFSNDTMYVLSVEGGESVG